MCGPQRALTVPTHSGRVCSHTDAAVPTGLQLQAPLFPGAASVAAGLTPSGHLPQHVSAGSSEARAALSSQRHICRQPTRLSRNTAS